MEHGGPMMPYYSPPSYSPMPIPYPVMQPYGQGCMIELEQLIQAYHHSKRTTRMLKHMMQSCPCPPPDPCGCGYSPCMGLCNTPANPAK